MENKKHLVVGANSFLAKQIILQINDNANVLGLYNNATNNFVNGVEYKNISELENLSDTFQFVFIISAFIPQKNNVEDVEKLTQINENLTTIICAKFKTSKIIFASSVSVYAFDGLGKNEQSICEPQTYYGISKLNAENIVKHHLSYAIVRISSMIGVGMKQTTFVPLIISNAIKNNKITLLGDGSRSQNYIDVNDVATIFIEASKHTKNLVLLAASTMSFSNLEIANFIEKKLPNISISLENTDNSPSFYYDATNTYKNINFTPQKSIENSITEIVEWQQKIY